MKILLAVVTILATQFASAEVGFFELDSPKVPASIRNAANSVARVMVQSGDSLTALTPHERSMVVAKTVNAGWKQPDWVQMQDQFCKTHELEICDFFSTLGKGTGFVFRNENEVATNAHILKAPIKKWLQHLDSGETNMTWAEKIWQMALVTDSEYFSDYQAGLKIKLINDDRRYWATQSNEPSLTQISDFIVLKTSKSTGHKPLLPAKTLPVPGEMLYVLGYPRKTSGRAALGGQDSNGDRMYVSIGKMLSAEEFLARMENINPGYYTTREIALFRKLLISGEFDCQVGNSGSPILNSAGEVVGIVTRLYGEREGDQPLCWGLRLGESDAELKQLWQTFDRS